MSGIALKVYNLFWRLAKKSEEGTVSITNARIARLVNARNEGKHGRADYIKRVKLALVKEGWLEFLGVSKGKQGTWLGGRYRAIWHEEWAAKMTERLGHSPCHPQAMVTRPSEFHPGGRAYKHQEVGTAARPEVCTAHVEAHTVKLAEAPTVLDARGYAEAHKVVVPGSPLTVGSRKHPQSVDFPTGRKEQKEQTPLPVPPKGGKALMLSKTEHEPVFSSLEEKLMKTEKPYPPVEKKEKASDSAAPGAFRSMRTYRPPTEAEREHERQRQKLDLEAHLKKNPHLAKKKALAEDHPEFLGTDEACEIAMAW